MPGTTITSSMRLAEGIVFRAHSGLYHVQPASAADDPVVCRLRGNLKKAFAYSTSGSLPRRVQAARKRAVTDPLCVGDHVRFDPARSVIEEVLPRRSELARRSPYSHEQHVLVANLDHLFLVVAVSQPAPNWRRLDQFLVLAATAGVPASIVANKCDLPVPKDDRDYFSVYEEIGYAVLFTSATAGAGLENLRGVMRGRITAFVGLSGVGKSSLLNALSPDLGLRIGRVSEIAGLGRHTTTGAELIPLGDEAGGWVADTPGLREIELWHVDADEVARAFPEFALLLGQCRFADCRHRNEPGCAVRAAHDRGDIADRRYDSFLAMTG